MVSYFRSSHRRCSVIKFDFRNFAKFAGKHLCQSLFFSKVSDLRPATLLKKRHWHRCFPVSCTKFLRTLFLQKTSGRLVLIFGSLRHFITKCDRCYYKMRHLFYYKMRQTFIAKCIKFCFLLENTTVLLQNA